MLVPLTELFDPEIMLPPFDVEALEVGWELKTDFHFDLSFNIESKADYLLSNEAILKLNGDVVEVDDVWVWDVRLEVVGWFCTVEVGIIAPCTIKDWIKSVIIKKVTLVNEDILWGIEFLF